MSYKRFSRLKGTKTTTTPNFSSMDFQKFPLMTVRELSAMEKLRGDLLSLLDDPKFGDVVIKVQNKEIHVHLSILACRSAYFAAMFGSDFREKNEGFVEITDFSADTVMGMLRFIYGGKPPELTCVSACELMKAADKYQLNELKEICEDFLMKKLDLDNALYVLYHAEACSFGALKRKALDYVSMNMGAFHNREMRCNIVRNSPELAEEILQKIAERAMPAKSRLSQLPSFTIATPASNENSGFNFRFAHSTLPSQDPKDSQKSD